MASGAVNGSVSIGRPKQAADEGDWQCAYMLDVGGRRSEHTCIGIDSLQALQLALTTSDGELRAKVRELDGELMFLGAPTASLFVGGGFGK